MYIARNLRPGSLRSLQRAFSGVSPNVLSTSLARRSFSSSSSSSPSLSSSSSSSHPASITSSSSASARVDAGVAATALGGSGKSAGNHAAFLSVVGSAHAPHKRSGTSAPDAWSHAVASASGPDAAHKTMAAYRRVLGNANAFKEGDRTVGVASLTEESRREARELLGRTTLGTVDAHPVFTDAQFLLCNEVDESVRAAMRDWSLNDLKRFVLSASHDEVQAAMKGLSSDVIGCLVRLMSNEELIALGSRIFNVVPGTQIGAKGYLGARIQPNSPTDLPEDIIWQCFSGFSYAVGDVMLGTNPVSSDPASVARVELALKDVVHTFGLQDILPHCVLAHIDVQAEAEKAHPGATALWFQSIAGSDDANGTFDLPIAKMIKHAETRSGRFGLYLETGQGADFTNGHDKGVDMVLHDARKYGFARALKTRIAKAQELAGKEPAPVLFINNVAGFIGPEVFRTREQLVRCCLEDIAMGKLHGLTIGLDVCSTLHMDVSLDDLDWCLDEILPANPGFLMALPTKNDPMLSYLTTSFQDHVRARHKFGYKVNDAMWRFFVEELRVVERDGTPTARFGDPAWVYQCYMRRRGDTRSDAALREEAQARMAACAKRGVPIASGFGKNPWDLRPDMERNMRDLYEDAKTTLWHQFSDEFIASIPNNVRLKTESRDRCDYVWHPETGERLSASSIVAVGKLRDPNVNVAIVISDGLCADAISDKGHLAPFLTELRSLLAGSAGSSSAPASGGARPPTVPLRVLEQNLVVIHGRVRAGYQIGEMLFSAGSDHSSSATLVHIIGERPGSGHHTFSVYLTTADRATWASARKVDHDITRVVSGIADSSYDPVAAAREAFAIICDKMARKL